MCALRVQAADDVTKTLERLDTRQVQTFQLLQSFEFDSDRKRQSVILRHPQTGAIILYVKGADSMVMSRLHPNSPFVAETQAMLNVSLAWTRFPSFRSLTPPCLRAAIRQ